MPNYQIAYLHHMTKSHLIGAKEKVDAFLEARIDVIVWEEIDIRSTTICFLMTVGVRKGKPELSKIIQSLSGSRKAIILHIKLFIAEKSSVLR